MPIGRGDLMEMCTEILEARQLLARPREARTTGRPSLTRITIAFITLGLSMPFIGIRREHTTEYYK